MADDNASAGLGEVVDTIHGIDLYIVWNSLNDERKRELAKFWLENRAIHDPNEAARRTKEVVCMALDAENRIAGVTTIYIGPYGTDKRPYWFYRTFVRPDCRLPGLTVRFFRASLNFLQEMAITQPGLSCGLMVMTENRRLKHPGWHRKLIKEGMHYVGVTRDGMEVWKHDFTSS